MLDLLEYIVSQLIADSTLTNIVPSSQILTGPVDITTEQQSQLLLPQINIHIVNESVNTVPKNTRNTMVQLDIWSRNNLMEVESIYEEILNVLDYMIADRNTSHIFWEVSKGFSHQYESDRRIFHGSMTLQCWVMKGN